MQYKNSLKDFKRWCNDHKTFMDSDIKHKEYFQAYNKDDSLYYIELNKIQIREFGKPFCGEAIFKYDEKEKNFIHISKYLSRTEKEYNLIYERIALTIKDFKERNGIEE